MSYVHSQKRKAIKRFKQRYGEKWLPHWRLQMARIIREKEGTPIGSVADYFEMGQHQGGQGNSLVPGEAS